MEVICEICKTKCMLIDGDFICQEGHVSKYVQEMAEEMAFVKISKKVKIKKEGSLYLSYDNSYKRILFFNLVFCCLAESLGLKNEKYFHYFINFLSGDRKEVFYDIKIDYTTICVLLYLTKREECKDEFLLYSDFVTEINQIKIDHRMKHFTKLLLIRTCPIYSTHKDNVVYHFGTRRDIVDLLSCEGSHLNSSEHRLYDETGLRNPEVEYNKMLFRNNFKCDLKCMLKYFKYFTELFCIEVTSEMVFYFEKFVYMRYCDKVIVFPEDDVCFFLFLYNKHNEIVFDYRKAYDNVTSLHQLMVPEEEDFVNILVVYFKTTEKKFLMEVQAMLFRSECRGSDRFFSGISFGMKYANDRRFYSIEIYIRRLKGLLKNKKNLKLKKEYVENNMI